MSAATPAPVLPAGAALHELHDGSLTRTELVTPGMCGPNSLFVGRLGDWAWDAVSRACSVNAYDARDAAGNPAYLSFSYFRIRGTADINPLSITFGDRLQVTSKVFGQGSESVLTLHRIRHDDGTPAVPVDPDRFHGAADRDSLRVEIFNRWISRTRPGSNRDLVRNAPVGFRHRHLPALPARYSPRLALAHARDNLAFDHDGAPPTVAEPFHVEYRVEPSRDLNGVGLLYFASYFSIVDWALLRLWRALGRDDRSFLRRHVTDQRICFLGNADADAVLDVAMVRRSAADAEGAADEVVDVVITEQPGGRVLAVAALRLCGERRAAS